MMEMEVDPILTGKARAAAKEALYQTLPRSIARKEAEKTVRALANRQLAEEVGVPIGVLASGVLDEARAKMLARQVESRRQTQFRIVLCLGIASAFVAGSALGALL